MEVLVVNEAVAVMVDHVEGFLELLDLVLVEHGEHIARRSLKQIKVQYHKSFIVDPVTVPGPSSWLFPYVQLSSLRTS